MDIAESILRRSQAAQESYARTLVRKGVITPAPEHFDHQQRQRHYKTEIGQKAHDAQRMFIGIPPTVAASKVCPHWFCQHSCASLDASIPKERRPICNLCHPQYIDYELFGRMGREFAVDPDMTIGCVQVMPNVNRCHRFAYNGWRGHDDFDEHGNQTAFCRKGNASLQATFDTFLQTHPHGAGLLFETQTGLFHKPDDMDMIDIIEKDMQKSFWFFKPMATEDYHDWKRYVTSRQINLTPQSIAATMRDSIIASHTVEHRELRTM